MSKNISEGLRVDYNLRSTFFYRKLHELGFRQMLAQVDDLYSISDSYKWDIRSDWSVSDTAWEFIAKANLNPLRVFAHPHVLLERPRLIAYYRSIAAISQKGVGALLFPVAAYEQGSNRRPLAEDNARTLASLLNQHISLIIDSATSFSAEDLAALLYASAGAQIQGGWNNAIGAEAEAVIRRLIVSSLIDAGLVVAFVDRRGATLPFNNSLDVASVLAYVYSVRLSNGAAVLFSSEPDVSLLDKDGNLVGAVEIKGGKDTAGALERYGAAKKSFDEAIRRNPNVMPVFIASCITAEVESRMASDPAFHFRYDLAQITTDDTARAEFLTLISSILGVQP